MRRKTGKRAARPAGGSGIELSDIYVELWPHTAPCVICGALCEPRITGEWSSDDYGPFFLICEKDMEALDAMEQDSPEERAFFARACETVEQNPLGRHAGDMGYSFVRGRRLDGGRGQ